MFRTMQDVRQANRDLGHMWFSPETMEYHGTTVESELIGGEWFVTKDRTYNGGQAYTIRHVSSNGDVHTERSTRLCQFSYWTDAEEGARRLARGLSADPLDDEDEDSSDWSTGEDLGDRVIR